MKKRKKKKATVEITIRINLYFVAFEYHISYEKQDRQGRHCLLCHI
ncbi:MULTISPECIES: hypothetical protein [unclassified Lactobacillus]|nr:MULTISPECIES: hypothetical protein [unclassified Lactobacillus]